MTNTYVNYSDYESMTIKDVRMDIACDRYKLLTPKSKTTEIDGKEVTVGYLEIKTIDDRMVYELVQDLDQKELTSLIRVLQSLNKQVQSINEPINENGKTCIK